MLITNSNFVGCSTGKVEGLSPFKMLCLAFREPINDIETSSPDVAQLAQPISETIERRPCLIRKDANELNFLSFLTKQGARPNNAQSANESYELASSHCLSRGSALGIVSAQPGVLEGAHVR